MWEPILFHIDICFEQNTSILLYMTAGVCVCVWFQPCMCSRLPCTHNIQLIKTDCSLSQSASRLLPPRVSPTLSPVCLSISPPLTLCLSVFLQEEKGISCGLVDLDFLKCSVGFPFMRAQTKVARTNMEFIARWQNCVQTSCRSLSEEQWCEDKQQLYSIMENSEWHTGLFCLLLPSIILRWYLTQVSSPGKMTHCSS